MRILFDHGTPSGIARALLDHEVVEARDLGCDRISNGDLLSAAEAAGFEILLTTDKRIRSRQNLTDRKLAIVVLANSTWRVVRLYLERIRVGVDDAVAGSNIEIDIPFK